METVGTVASFLERHWARMQHYIDSLSPESFGDPELDAFIETLQREYHDVAPVGPPARSLLPGEEVFIWCLDQLDMLADPCSGVDRRDPYACQLVAELKEMAPRLAARQSLPPHCQLHFIDPLDDEDWFEEDAMPSTGAPDVSEDPA